MKANDSPLVTPLTRQWRSLGLLFAGLTVAAPLLAQTATTAEEASVEEPAQTTRQTASIGHATRSLLQLQREQADAGTKPRQLDGAMVDSAYQRYLKSFEHELPVWFGQQMEPPSN